MCWQNLMMMENMKGRACVTCRYTGDPPVARMDSYGSVWTRMGPYGPWGLPGGFLGPPGALGGPERGVKGGSPPGGARGALLGGLPISLRGILTYMPLRAAYGICSLTAVRCRVLVGFKEKKM